jgi:hypothetical protein
MANMVQAGSGAPNYVPRPMGINVTGPVFGNQAGGAGPVKTGQSSQQSGQYFTNPNLVNSLSAGMGNTINQANQGYMDFISNPTQSPYYQNALSGVLASLVPAEQAGQRSLMDMFRASGNANSSTGTSSMADYASQMDRNRLAAASNLLTTMFPQIAQAMFAPMGQTDALINSLKMNQSSGESTQWGFPPQAGGGGGGGGSVSFQQGTSPWANVGGIGNTSAPGQRTGQPTNYTSQGPLLSSYDWGNLSSQDNSGWY